MNQLEIYLDVHIQWLKEVIPIVPPNEDLPGMLSFSAPGIPVVMLPMPDDPGDGRARDKLQEAGASCYATINAAWTTLFDGLDPAECKRLLDIMAEHGSSHPEIKPRRQECYVVGAGDKQQTLVAVFIVKRNRKGKITDLIRQSDPAGAMWAGSMTNLLITTH